MFPDGVKVRLPLFDVTKALMMLYFVFVLFVVDRLLRVNPRLSFIGTLGTTTMGIYVLHEVFLIKAGAKLPLLPLPSFARLSECAVKYFRGDVLEEDLDTALKSFSEGKGCRYDEEKIELDRKRSLDWVKSAIEVCK